MDIGGYLVAVEEATLSIEDERTVAKNRGIPNGWVSGEVGAEGELTLDAENFALLEEAADSAGSWRGIDPVDIVFNAETPDGTRFKVEAFGCLLKLGDVLSLTAAGGEKHVTKIPYVVTGSDFVKINDVSYLSNDEVDGLTIAA